MISKGITFLKAEIATPGSKNDRRHPGLQKRTNIATISTWYTFPKGSKNDRNHLGLQKKLFPCFNEETFPMLHWDAKTAETLWVYNNDPKSTPMISKGITLLKAEIATPGRKNDKNHLGLRKKPYNHTYQA